MVVFSECLIDTFYTQEGVAGIFFLSEPNGSFAVVLDGHVLFSFSSLDTGRRRAHHNGLYPLRGQHMAAAAAAAAATFQGHDDAYTE